MNDAIAPKELVRKKLQTPPFGGLAYERSGPKALQISISYLPFISIKNYVKDPNPPRQRLGREP